MSAACRHILHKLVESATYEAWIQQHEGRTDTQDEEIAAYSEFSAAKQQRVLNVLLNKGVRWHYRASARSNRTV